MKTYLAGEDITFRVPLRMQGEPVVPDAGSVKLTVRDNTGQILVDKAAVSMDLGSTEATVTILAVNNALGAGRFTNRTVIIHYTKTGRPQEERLAYRLTAWLNTTVTPSDVRNFLGVDDKELPDADIDIMEAYLDVETDVTEAILTAALAGADQKQTAANRMILAKTVLNQIPGLPLRITQNSSDGVFSAQRPKIDFVLLEQRAQAMYADAGDLVASRLEITQDLFIAPAIAPDPITGG